MKIHEVEFHTNGETMYAVCKSCGASARVRMQRYMTERNGWTFDHIKARSMLRRHLMQSGCEHHAAATFALIN